jgi:hypothetical protein
LAEEFSDITAAFDAYACSMSEGRYFDAHEDVEAIWYPRRFEANDEVLLWKGFINAAVSFELINRGKAKPAQIAWQTYLKYRILLENLITPHKELYVKIEALIHIRRLECQNF